MGVLINPYRFGILLGPAITLVPYLNYRIVVTAVDGGTLVSCGEVEMLDGSGINFLRLGSNAGVLTVNATGAGSSAALPDFYHGSGWQSTASLPSWVKWTATGTEEFTGCMITPAASVLNRSPKNFTVEYSDDDSAWTAAVTVVNQTAWTNTEPRRFTWASVGLHKYWRLHVTAVDGGTSLALNDICFFKADGAASSSAGGSRSAIIKPTSNFGGEEGYRIADGSTATGWTSNGNVPQTITFAIPVAKALASLKWTSRSTEGARSPKDFTIGGSNDGSTWTTLKTVVGSTGWGSLETRTFTG